MAELSSVVRALRPGVFAELERAVAARRARGETLVPLHIGDTHLSPPKGARFEAACAGEGDAALYAYGATAGLAELRAALSEAVARRGRAHPGATGEHVHVGAGATHALLCAVKAIVEPGDDALLAAPYWPLAHGILTVAGARVVEAPVRGARLLGEELAAAITPRTRVLYIITPNNPDGRVLSRADLESAAELARDRDLWVIADEVYADYVFEGEHVSFARLPGMAERTITAFSFSKSHALAGARVGFVVADPALVAAARRVSVHSVFNVPVVSQRAALAALRDEAWIEGARAAYRAARDRAATALREAGVPFVPAAGGVYLFCDFERVLCGRPLGALLEHAVDAHGVLLAPGPAFGSAYDTCARLCYTSVPPGALEDGLGRLIGAIRSF